MLNNNIRWNIEQKKIENSQHPLTAKLRTLPIYSGPRNTKEELDFLYKQAHIQAELLQEWNEAS